MLFSVEPKIEKRREAELLAIPFWHHGQKAKSAMPLGKIEQSLKPALFSKDFNGKEGELLLVYSEGQKEPRFLLFGLGEEGHLSIESLRKAYAGVARFCQKKGIKDINVLLPVATELRSISVEDCLKGICEGILLTNYKWSQKSEKNNKNELLQSVCLIGTLSKYQPLFESFEQVSEAVYLARDLINGNADIVTPIYLGEVAKKLSSRFPTIKTKILDQEDLEKEKMGLLLAVGRGSSHSPLLIQMHYQGNPGSKEHTVLIGKGITFDTGGLNLKPSSSMETMRDDMSGAATVMGTIAAVAALKLKVNVTALVPTAENAIDANSFKPGDVYKSYNGKTVEIKDTDAEGRLILADALAYAAKNLSPTRMIDLATLTGSMVVALGEEMSGFFSNEDKFAKKLAEASEVSHELLWRMPLHQPYKELLKSDIADLKNIGGRPGGSILAALFLEEFVANIPWIHIDIAGTAFNTKEREYTPKNGVGFGIRLLVEFFQKNSK